MEESSRRMLKDKMLACLYRDSGGPLSGYSDMIEIGLELNCDDETSRELAMSLFGDGLIQFLDGWTFDAMLTEAGKKHLDEIKEIIAKIIDNEIL